MERSASTRFTPTCTSCLRLQDWWTIDEASDHPQIGSFRKCSNLTTTGNNNNKTKRMTRTRSRMMYPLSRSYSRLGLVSLVSLLSSPARLVCCVHVSRSIGTRSSHQHAGQQTLLARVKKRWPMKDHSNGWRFIDRRVAHSSFKTKYFGWLLYYLPYPTGTDTIHHCHLNRTKTKITINKK